MKTGNHFILLAKAEAKGQKISKYLPCESQPECDVLSRHKLDEERSPLEFTGQVECITDLEAVGKFVELLVGKLPVSFNWKRVLHKMLKK